MMIPFREIEVNEAFLYNTKKDTTVIMVKYLEPIWGKVIYSTDLRFEVNKYYHIKQKEKVIKL